MRTRVLLATLCDQRLTIDDCTHRNTYRFYASAYGVEIECRYTTKYCPPWATADERKPRVEKEKVRCSEDLAKMLNDLRSRSFPICPCPPTVNVFYKDMSIKFGDETSAASFA